MEQRNYGIKNYGTKLRKKLSKVNERIIEKRNLRNKSEELTHSLGLIVLHIEKLGKEVIYTKPPTNVLERHLKIIFGW